MHSEQTPESPEIDLIKEALLLLRSSPPENNSAVTVNSVIVEHNTNRHIVSPTLVPKEDQNVESHSAIAPRRIELSDDIMSTNNLRTDQEGTSFFPLIDSKHKLNPNLKSTIHIVVRNLQEDKTKPMYFVAFLLSCQLQIPSEVLVDTVVTTLQQEMLIKEEICFSEYQKYMKLLTKLAEMDSNGKENNNITYAAMNSVFQNKIGDIKNLFERASIDLNARNWDGK